MDRNTRQQTFMLLMGVIEEGLYLVELGRSGKQLQSMNKMAANRGLRTPASPKKLTARLVLKLKHFKTLPNLSILMKQFPN